MRLELTGVRLARRPAKRVCELTSLTRLWWLIERMAMDCVKSGRKSQMCEPIAIRAATRVVSDNVCHQAFGCRQSVVD